MPPNVPPNTDPESQKFGWKLPAAFAVVVLAALGAWYWYASDTAAPATHSEFYTALSAKNASFTEAEKLASQLRFDEALLLYQAALQAASNDDEAVQIRLLIARMLVQTARYAEAVPLLKEIVAVDGNPRVSRARALAVEELSGVHARGIAEVSSEIFKDEPFKSLFIENRSDLTLRHMHEYAISISPIATAELWIAQWYAYQLPVGTAKSKLSPDTIADYKAKIAQLVSAADSDIAYMQTNGTMGADLRFALSLRAIVTGMLIRAGDTSFGDAHAHFDRAIDAYAQAGSGLDCVPRYHYALFMVQSNDAGKEADIRTILQPLGDDAYVQSRSCAFLKEARSSSYYRQFPMQLAKIDPDFKAFLQTLGWTEADFSS